MAGTTEVVGNSIRTNLPIIGFITGPPTFLVDEVIDLGPLAPGTYSYEIYETDSYPGGPPFLPQLLARQTIVVVPPPVPTTNRVGLLILAVSISAVAWVTFARCCA